MQNPLKLWLFIIPTAAFLMRISGFVASRQAHALFTKSISTNFMLNNIRGLTYREIFKENGGEKPFPSIDEYAKQQQLKILMQQYKSGIEKRVFDDAVVFPCEFMVKIIGVNDPTFLDDTLIAVGRCSGQSPSAIKCSTKITSGGKYLSISLSPIFQQSSQIYEAYDVVSKDSRVKFML